MRLDLTEQLRKLPSAQTSITNELPRGRHGERVASGIGRSVLAGSSAWCRSRPRERGPGYMPALEPLAIGGRIGLLRRCA
jgi:hypothetical protein